MRLGLTELQEEVERWEVVDSMVLRPAALLTLVDLTPLAPLP